MNIIELGIFLNRLLDLQRHAKGRKDGKRWEETEFYWLQHLGKTNSSILFRDIEIAIHNLSSSAQETVFGIKAETGEMARNTLTNWVNALSLPRGLLYAYDQNGKEIHPYELNDSRVYIKYNSSSNGVAVMKDFRDGDNSGVIFQVQLPPPSASETVIKGEFHQSGDFPLFLFREQGKKA
jgi:hypothetical protein